MGLVQADLDEMSGESRLAEEKAQHCMVDAARLADELRAEQVGNKLNLMGQCHAIFDPVLESTKTLPGRHTNRKKQLREIVG